jgi:hypothetical protein
MHVVLLLAVFLWSLASAADVAGQWSGIVDVKTTAGESNQVRVLAEFAQERSAVTGWIGPSAEQRFSIEQGTVEGAIVTFQAAMPTRVYKMRLQIVLGHRVVAGGRGYPPPAAARGPLSSSTQPLSSSTQPFGSHYHACLDVFE